MLRKDIKRKYVNSMRRTHSTAMAIVFFEWEHCVCLELVLLDGQSPIKSMRLGFGSFLPLLARALWHDKLSGSVFINNNIIIIDGCTPFNR